MQVIEITANLLFSQICVYVAFSNFAIRDAR